jgi:hypothetical protein
MYGQVRESDYVLSGDQEKWVEVRAKRYGISREVLRSLIRQQRGRCAWSNIPMKFDLGSLNPPTDHIAATLDHSSPASDADGYTAVCHYLNDTKGKLPRYLFDALRQTAQWQAAMARMRRQFDETPQDSDKIIEVFKKTQGLEIPTQATTAQKLEPSTTPNCNPSKILQGGKE